MTVCFCLATDLGGWFQTWEGNRAESAGLLAAALGEARHMFANHFFVKADAYFHSGFYPTIYDNLQSYQTPHIAEDSGAIKGNNTGDENTFLGPPRNWIDAFGRQFYPSVHTHLTQGGASGDEDPGAVREIMPWLKLSSELDPRQVATYTVASYWLRSMGKADDAEAFLREGLKENPGSPQLLFDLGRLFFESRHDPARARNVWEAALANLVKLPDADSTENKYVKEETLAQLASLEQKTLHPDKAIFWLEQLKEVSPNPDDIRNWIKKIKSEEMK